MCVGMFFSGCQSGRSVICERDLDTLCRGDVDREFASSLGVRSFPTVLAFRKAGGKPFVYGSTVRTPKVLQS